MRKKYYYLPICILSFVAVLICSSCGRDNSKRTYEEIVISAPAESSMGAQTDPHAFMKMPEGMQMMAGQNTPEIQEALNKSVVKPSLSWETPQGWTEQAGSAMRMVTFSAQDESGVIDCSIISLVGQAGGVASNVIRWMKQINVTVPSDVALNEFLSRQEIVKTKGGFPIKVIDLTEFAPADQEVRATMQPFEEGQAPSMLAAMAELEDKVIFVKMTGNKAAVLANRESFKSLCGSLVLEK